jgi:hypothetical protein
MTERKHLDPDHCLAKESEYRQRSADWRLSPEGRASLLNMAATWASLAKESEAK